MTRQTIDSNRFIGRFENHDGKTGVPNGDGGYIALTLSDEGRVPQTIIVMCATLDELIAALKDPARAAVYTGKIGFEPPRTFRIGKSSAVSVPQALELDEIYKVQTVLGLA